MGRPKSDVHTYFNRYLEGDKKMVRCKFCDKTYFQNASKMTNHVLKQCKNVPEDVLWSLKQTDATDSQSQSGEPSEIFETDAQPTPNSPTVTATLPRSPNIRRKTMPIVASNKRSTQPIESSTSLNMRKSLKRRGSPLPMDSGSHYSNCKHLLDELCEIFIECRPNCKTCETYITKLSIHMLSTHGSSPSRSAPELKKHSKTDQQFSQSTEIDSPTRSLRARSKRVNYAELNAGDENLAGSSVENCKKLKHSVLPFKNSPTEKSTFLIPPLVPTHSGISDSNYAEDGTTNEISKFGETPEINVKCEIDIDHEFEYMADPDPDPELIVGDLNYDIDPEYMNHSVHVPEHVDGDPDFEVTQEEEYPESNDEGGDSDGDPDYSAKTKLKSFSSTRKPKRKWRGSKRGVRAFACDQCPRKYSYHRDLITHFRTVHPDTTEKPYTCPTCDEKFFSKQYLKRHIGQVHGGTGTADVTSTRRRSKAKGRILGRRKPELQIHSCDQCDRKYTYERDLITHRRTVHPDTTEKPYECLTCQEKFFSSRQLKAHINESHPGQEIYFCKKCYIAGFVSELEFQTHMKTHEVDVEEMRFSCGQCAKSFKSEVSFNRHIKLHEGHRVRIRKREERNYACVHCPRKYSYHRDLITHTRNLHSEVMDKPYCCHVCEEKYFSNRQLKTHMKEAHPGVLPYECSYCRKRFYKESEYVVHKQIHTIEKRFTCEYCGRGFPIKAKLVRHLRTHTREKPYVCEFCGKSYGTSEYLIIHKRGHTGERPYMCDQCSMCFTGKTALNKHAASHRK